MSNCEGPIRKKLPLPSLTAALIINASSEKSPFTFLCL